MEKSNNQRRNQEDIDIQNETSIKREKSESSSLGGEGIKGLTLDRIYYEKGRQSFDFELAALKKQGEETKSFMKWTSYRQIFLNDSPNASSFLNKINIRTILPNEIVLDKEEREGIDEIIETLERYNLYYECYETGSRGFHIHIWFNEEISEDEKTRFIDIFKCDSSKKGKRTGIALENVPHFKTGKPKIIYKQNEGSNSKVTLQNFLDNYIPIESLNILENPNLFNLINNELSKKIEGEEESRATIFLCSCGRLVQNHQLASYNLLVNDISGTGKDFVTYHTLGIIPKIDFVYKTRISPTVFTYWHNSKNEPNWTWNGKVFYCEDISEDVLNSEVFKVMCSSGSEAIVIIKQEAVEIHIEGKPVMVTTTASATPSSELLRRFAILNLDSSQNQTRAIMKRKSLEAKEGIKEEYEERIIKAQSFLKKVRVKIPYADKIDPLFPDKNVVMRTNYPRFLDLIKASTALHQFQREKDESGVVIATKQDHEIARNCFIRLCSNKYMVALTKNQQEILNYFINNPEEKINANGLIGHSDIDLTLKALIDNLNKLVNLGLLERELRKNEEINRDIMLYGLSKSYKPNEELKVPDFEDLMKNE